jgi:BirA family biotin operon repressor/biotin-[acetyl-CoA-carboxylase] ligase
LQNNTFSTLFVGQNLIRLPAVDSTNNFLKRMVSNSEPLPEGTVIMADNQYAGRGQQNNTWHAAPGLNLTMSIFLKPFFVEVTKQFMLNMAISVGIRNALQEVAGKGISIKWPNDIYFGGRKLGGVLIENTINGSVYKTAIVGIGINVNQVNFDGRQIKTGISLREILQRDVNLMELLADICKKIEAEYLKLKGNSGGLALDYLSGLYKFGEIAAFSDAQGTFEGRIEDVSESGQLIVRKGTLMAAYGFKEIEFLTDLPDLPPQVDVF